MPKKQLTADVAREIASAIEDGTVEKLSIRPRLSGRNKGKLFADWKIAQGELTDYNPEYVTLKLVETLEDVAIQLEKGAKIELTVNKDIENQFVSYIRGE